MSAALASCPTGGSPALQRARGAVRVAFADGGAGVTRLVTLYQAGSGKARLPRPPAGGPPVAVLLNTAGGLTGGDRFEIDISVGDGAAAIATTQTAERVYRRLAGCARVSTRLSVGRGARLSWLPQETIVFDDAGLDRSLDIELAEGARLVACEAIVLGRAAMGETVRRAELSDRWTVRIAGRLAFADRLRLVGDAAAILAGPATGGGARAFATAVVAGEGAAERLEAIRGHLADALRGGGESVEGGASALDGVVVVRLLTADATRLRAVLARLLVAIEERPLPRVWSC